MLTVLAFISALIQRSKIYHKLLPPKYITAKDDNNLEISALTRMSLTTATVSTDYGVKNSENVPKPDFLTMQPPTVEELAKLIDHSVIDPFHTEQDLIQGVALAKQYRTGQFVTQPFRVAQAKKLLDGSGIKLQTFVGYPHGSDHTEVKILQAKRALEDGVEELDMVINLSALLSGDIDYVEQDIRAIVETAKVS